MNKMKKLLALVTAVALMGAAVPVGAEEEWQAKGIWEEKRVFEEAPAPTIHLDATIKVNENTIQHAVEKRVLSMQTELSDHNAAAFMDLETHQIKPEFKEFAEELYDYPVFRWGGTSAEDKNLANNFGLFKDRKPTVHQFTGAPGAQPQHFGLAEYLGWMYSINPNAEIIPCLSMTCNTPEDSAHIAQFLCDEADESEWGAMRAQAGYPEPVKVFAFEMGNEVDIHTGLTNEKTNAYWPEWNNEEEYAEFGEWYSDVALKHCEAIRAVVPDAKFIILGKSGNERSGMTDSMMRVIIDRMRDYVNYISQHRYYDGVALSHNLDHNRQILEICEEVLGPDHGIKIAVTEHARWFSSGPYYNHVRPIALGGALSVGKFLSRSIEDGYTAVANYHGIQGHNNTGWASYFATEEFGYANGVIGHMYKFFGAGLGDRVVEYSLESEHEITDKTSTQQRFSALVTATGDKELDIILINEKDDHDFNLTFEFANNYTLVEEDIFTAPNLDSFITVECNGVNPLQITHNQKNEANFSSYHMPAKSIVHLKLRGNKSIPGLSNGKGGETVEEYDAAFADITYHWAKNQISALAEMGLVQGNEEGLFLPEDGITRAEFAAMLTRTLELPTDYPNAYFDDVSSDAWYAKEVNAVFCSGLMKGKAARTFDPEAPITLEEVVATVARTQRSRGEAMQIDTDAVVASIADANAISPWARNDVAYAVGTGMMRRVNFGGWSAAAQSASRAQTAVLIYAMHGLLN
ncbi:MAG: hypothetical protein E7409_04465 [Ruminococcaceae bacterium]|nr:hypothetical protein [Oscillospiraceae bacterium]